MKLEAGKFYKTRNGLKFGPAEEVYPFGNSGWMVPSSTGHPATYDSYGNRVSPTCLSEEDLVAEWHDGPIRTVTRREIVTGSYSNVNVLTVKSGSVVVQLVNGSGSKTSSSVTLSAEELREAAHLFNQLAEVLEENK